MFTICKFANINITYTIYEINQGITFIKILIYLTVCLTCL